LLYLDNPKLSTSGKAPSSVKYIFDNDNHTVTFRIIIKKTESMLLYEEQKVTNPPKAGGCAKILRVSPAYGGNGNSQAFFSRFYIIIVQTVRSHSPYGDWI